MCVGRSSDPIVRQIKLSKGGEQMDNLWSVYIHTNKHNGKKYIGITSQIPENRWLNGHGYNRKLKFGRAIAKYGWNGFEHEIIYTGLSETEAKKIECDLISRFSTQDDKYGYNMTSGGDGVCGLKHTDAAKQKMSICKSGSSHPNYNKHLNKNTRTKIATRLKGNKNAAGSIRSNETKERMASAKKKPVAMYINGMIIRCFDSAIDAQEETGINRKNISACCLGHRKTAGGYNWKFA